MLGSKIDVESFDVYRTVLVPGSLTSGCGIDSVSVAGGFVGCLRCCGGGGAVPLLGVLAAAERMAPEAVPAPAAAPSAPEGTPTAASPPSPPSKVRGAATGPLLSQAEAGALPGFHGDAGGAGAAAGAAVVTAAVGAAAPV